MPRKTKTIRRTKPKTSRISKKNETPKKRLATKAARPKPRVKAKPKSRPKKKVQKKKQNADSVAFSLSKPGVRSGRQSGDLQRLSSLQGADSESVAELVEEGNPIEAEVVSGVEAADSDEREVRTHEVPEDDVPEEYRDK